MITRLDQLTADEFFDIMCGKFSALNPNEENIDVKVLAQTAREIVMEYRSIVDPAGQRAFLATASDVTRARGSVMFFALCNVMIATEQFYRVRNLLEDVDINATSMSDQRLAAEVESRLERAKRDALENSEDDHEDATPEELHRGFERQTAALMAHFKFQIDTSKMRATLYAQLVARHIAEQKARAQALKK